MTRDTAIHPCHHEGCNSAGMYGENDFLKPNNDRPPLYWCFEHRSAEARGAKGDRPPKLKQPELAL